VIYTTLINESQQHKHILTCTHVVFMSMVALMNMIYINLIILCSDPGTSTNAAPKKRRRKDASTDNNQIAPGDHFNTGDVLGKSSGRGSSQAGKPSSSNIGSYGQYYEDNIVPKNKTGAPGGPKRKSSDFAVGADAALHAKTSSKDISNAPLEITDMEKHKAAAFQPIDYAYKSKISETYDYAYPAYRDKGASIQLDSQQRKASGENKDQSNRIHRKEKHGISEYPSMAMASATYSTQTEVIILFHYFIFCLLVQETTFNPLPQT
jgi:hypothetical protein